MKLMRQLWNDESGFVVSAELILIATIAVLGLLVGLASVRDGVTSELSDVAGAFQDANQSYSVDGVIGHNANSAGFDFIDDTDECDDNDQDHTLLQGADNCITFDGPGGDAGEVEEGGADEFTPIRNGPFP
jgi:Flp pilus assembly pilin Flp